MRKRSGRKVGFQRVETSNPSPSSPRCLIPRCAFLLAAATLLICQTGTTNITFPDQDNGTIYRRFLIGFLPALTANKGQNKHFVGAFKYALEYINKGVMEKHGYHIDYTVVDNKADTVYSLRALTKLYFNGTIAFIGPEDTCAIEARLAAAWDLPMIAFKCRDSAVSNHKLYPTFARTIPSTYKVSKSVISLMKYFGWTHFQAVVGESTNWKEAATTLVDLAKQNEIDMSRNVYFSEPYIGANEMPSLIERTYRNTRIYVFLGDPHALIDFVRTMADRNLDNGDYLVIAVQDEIFDTKNKYKYFKKYVENLEPPMVDAFEMVLMLLPRPPSNPVYKEFLIKSREYSYQSPFNAPLPPLPNLSIPVPIYASYLYDAVYLYCRALLECLQKGIDPRNGTAILSRIKNRMYESIQGHKIYIDEYGDAEANYTVVALVEDDSGGLPDIPKSLQPVGHFNNLGRDTIPHFHYEREIDWIGGQVPASEPVCGFDGSQCRFRPDWPTALACIIATSVVATAVIFFGRHYIYEQKLASLLWKIDYKDLLMADPEHEPAMTDKMRGRFGRLSYLSNEDSKEDTAKIARSAFTKIASYKSSLVAVKMLKKKHVELTRAIKKELHLMREMSHDNLNRFIGACIDPPHVCIITQYCARGSLKDILENEDLHLDDMFIASLVFDLIKGMIFLHESEIVSHGNLKSSNCLVDSRWVLQIADHGLHSLRTPNGPAPAGTDDVTYYEKLLWRAPELLRDRCAPTRGTQKGDVYSFAMILVDIHGRSGPWGQTSLSNREIVERVKCPVDGWLYRPDILLLKCQDFVIRCIQECWTEEPDQRPDFKYIRMRLKPMQEGLSSNIFDNMLAIMEKYANTLESLVDERTLQLAQEKKTTETLLLRMLPKSVAEQLINGEQVIPEHYECVTIYFSDIVGFTSLSAESTPLEVVDMLNDLYTSFDSIIEGYDVYKVETIGDAYMVVSGLPIRNGDNHAGEVASMSLHLLKAIKDFRIRHRPDETLMLRIGIHSGPVVAGVVGLKMPRYCLFGDTVNTASRMESFGQPLKIHCSAQCKQLLDKLGGYHMEERGPVSMKGKGEMFTYFLVDEDVSQRRRRMSIDKPELFLSDLWSIPLTPIADDEPDLFHPDLRNIPPTPSIVDDKVVLPPVDSISQVLFDASNLPLVIVTNSPPAGCQV